MVDTEQEWLREVCLDDGGLAPKKYCTVLSGGSVTVHAKDRELQLGLVLC